MAWIDPLRNTIVGLDTAPLIYFIEKHPRYLPILRSFFEAVDDGEIQVISSTLTLTEVLVVPYRLQNHTLVTDYTRILLHSRNVTLLPVSNPIALEAARLRALHRYRVPDAIHLATAVIGRASAFLTNDNALTAIPGLQSILLDQLLPQP